MKRFFKVLGVIVATVIILAGIGIGVLTIAEYRPADVETIIENHPVEAVLHTGEEYSVISWNCGYGALGDNADFFMDGGTSVYTADQGRLMENLDGIVNTLQEEADADIILLQEVDINSDRSYHTDEREILKQVLPEGANAFAYNFNVLYLPYPLPPIGHVESGLYTISRADIREAERIALPCPFSWPVRMVNLRRCLLISRIPLTDTDRELVVINLHLEAYDDGPGREAQTSMLIDLLYDEYEKGNYVIAGGDFNQECLDPDISNPYRSKDAPWQPGQIDTEDIKQDFRVFMDTSVPSCRSLDKAIAGADKDNFFYYLIDGYIVSDNVQINEAASKTINAGFVYSDHNPVKLTITLLP